MATHYDWLPSSYAERHDLVTRTWNYLHSPGTRQRMGFATGTPLGDWFDATVTPAFTAYDAAVLRWKNEAMRNIDAISRLQAAEKTFLPLFRKLYVALLKENPLVTNVDLTGMGLPKRSAGRSTLHHPPQSLVSAHVLANGFATLEIHYRDEHSFSTAKPKNVHGALLNYKISDTEVTSHDELLHEDFSIRTPFRITFPDPERGKTFYFALRWENNHGEKGPWSVIMHAVIP
jgi:hypothetical protein